MSTRQLPPTGDFFVVAVCDIDWSRATPAVLAAEPWLGILADNSRRLERQQQRPPPYPLPAGLRGHLGRGDSRHRTPAPACSAVSCCCRGGRRRRNRIERWSSDARLHGGRWRHRLTPGRTSTREVTPRVTVDDHDPETPELL
ncbi:hypothetical protein HPB48_016009 [Haemaphysalis longicornis]|uniref:Uncharacterized protein n=1 Tax=Haemaphysalis longicornis TaxID=44386 RepID=A0A9J6G136_HAELO|nr:hypothetical protein HPB48_016009 [Haemaphysalis longicornis]